MFDLNENVRLCQEFFKNNIHILDVMTGQDDVDDFITLDTIWHQTVMSTTKCKRLFKNLNNDIIKDYYELWQSDDVQFMHKE